MRQSVRLSLWITLLGVTAIRAASPLTVTVVQGHSMEPTLRPGTVSVLNRSYYRSHPVSRGDIVVLKRDDGTVIKRVHALPGDQVTLLRYDNNEDNELLTPIQATRLSRLQAAGWLKGAQVVTLTILPGQCFVLGDNREASADSRLWGPVPMGDILGRAVR